MTRIAALIELDLRGTVVSLDGVYDCRLNRKAIFDRGMVPNINLHPRDRRSSKRGRKPFFDKEIFKERFNTIERVFGWEDKIPPFAAALRTLQSFALRAQIISVFDDQPTLLLLTRNYR